MSSRPDSLMLFPQSDSSYDFSYLVSFMDSNESPARPLDLLKPNRDGVNQPLPEDVGDKAEKSLSGWEKVLFSVASNGEMLSSGLPVISAVETKFDGATLAGTAESLPTLSQTSSSSLALPSRASPAMSCSTTSSSSMDRRSVSNLSFSSQAMSDFTAATSLHLDLSLSDLGANKTAKTSAAVIGATASNTTIERGSSRRDRATSSAAVLDGGRNSRALASAVERRRSNTIVAFSTIACSTVRTLPPRSSSLIAPHVFAFDAPSMESLAVAEVSPATSASHPARLLNDGSEFQKPNKSATRKSSYQQLAHVAQQRLKHWVTTVPVESHTLPQHKLQPTIAPKSTPTVVARSKQRRRNPIKALRRFFSSAQLSRVDSSAAAGEANRIKELEELVFKPRPVISKAPSIDEIVNIAVHH